MTPDYETRSPEAYIAKPSEVRTVYPRPKGMMSREELLAYVAKSEPPQSWYEETADPFEADERDTPNPAVDAINAKISANYDALCTKAVENRRRVFGCNSL